MSSLLSEVTPSIHGTTILTQNKRRYDKSIRPQDDAQYKARTAKLAAQVSIYEVLPGQFVDGQLTLRETVPDLGGIAITYDAYQNSLKGKPAPIIDGLTGDQRFFLAWAQNWRSKFRDEYTAQLLKTDFHPPQKIRPDFVILNTVTSCEF